MADRDIQSLLKTAEQGINSYLEDALNTGRIDGQLYESARRATFKNLKDWLTDPEIDRLSDNAKEGIARTIEAGHWEALVNAFRQYLRFGTGGIRGMMAFDKESIVQMKDYGLDVPILKGPNTLNDLVLLRTSAGVAKFGQERKPPLKSIVIGYDSRIRGHDLAKIVAQLFLAYDYTVYFFDAPCPYPEVTFAIPNLQADMGILISASHNDYRYNGYKLSSANGSQFDPEERDKMYNQYIVNSAFEDVKLTSFADAAADKLHFLGGDAPLEDYDYAGKKDNLIDMHERHIQHVQSFLMMDDLAAVQEKDPLNIGFCAYHGAGRLAVPRILSEVGFEAPNACHEDGLNELNGLFPSFCSEPGKEQQPDPGDKRAAKTAVQAYKKEYGEETFDKTDILIGTDPDADRCGIVVKVPENQQDVAGDKDWMLLPADEAWSVLLWYRLEQEVKKHGSVQDADSKFIVLSHTTADTTARIAKKYGLGVVKTLVGFAALAASTRMVWDGQVAELTALHDGRDGEDYQDLCHPIVCETEKMNDSRSFNMAAMEQSNGFSLLGGPPKDNRSLGTGGHVRDKDGTFAALLMAEVAAYARSQGRTLMQILDEEIYLDPDVGLFVNFYEPDPLDGEYPGIEGDRLKKAILRRALGFFQLALAGDLSIGGRDVLGATMYRTGKYDALYPATWDFVFPDEGIRFFFDEEHLEHLTIRPSGTGNSLRFHIQLHSKPSSKEELVTEKRRLKAQGEAMMDHLRKMLKAPR
ncbi:MAG: hypothetical protein ACLFV7_11385 [Phycisphaerae bacterium]